jgi:hypothetical protein
MQSVITSDTLAMGDVYEQMEQMITGHWITQMIHALARYSVADHLSNAPRGVEEIAEAEGLDRDATLRFLRACASFRLVTEEGGCRFGSTPLLDTLRKSNSRSLRGLALTMPAPGQWLPWGRFAEALKTGERQTVAALGSEIFDYYARTPTEATAFTDAMRGLGTATAYEAARVIDTTNVSCVSDIGGADGTLLFALLNANPKLQGIVYDLPNVIPSVAAAATLANVQNRVRAVSGDFFVSVPPADLYLLRAILHGWDDNACINILKNCRQAIQLGGRVIVIEYMLGEVSKPGLGTLMDLHMMVMSLGRERSVSEYQSLFERAGFGRVNVIPANMSTVILEAFAD